MQHQYVVTEPLDPAGSARGDHRARPRPHRLLPARGRRAARRRLLARPGHLGRRRARCASRGRCSTPDLERFAESWARRAAAACPALRERRDRQGRPRARRRSPPTASSCSARPRVAGLWVGGRVLRARPRRRRRRRQGDGRVDRRRHARVRRRRDGHPPLRRALRSRAYARVARARRLLALLRRRLPARGARRPDGRCGSRRPTRGCRRSTRRFGEKAGWERVNWFDVNAGGGRRGAAARAAGPGGIWSPAIGAECLATRDAAGLFDQSSFAKLDVRGPRRGRGARAGSAPTTSTARSAPRSTPSCSTSAAGIEADLTVTRLGEEHFRVVTGTAFGARDLAWIRRHLPDDGSVRRRRRHRRARLPVPVGAARPRDPPAAHRRRPLQRGLPVPAGAPDRRSAPCRCSPSGSPSSASSAGSCTARPSTG